MNSIICKYTMKKQIWIEKIATKALTNKQLWSFE
jgi:hypothetical protein